MRILIVVHGYPPTHMGGAELRAARTAGGLAARHHDVAVLCIESLVAPETQLADGELQDGVLVYKLQLQRGTDIGEGYQRSGSPVIQEALRKLICEWHPDLIHFFSGYLMGTRVIDTAVAYDVPLVVSLTDYWWLCHRINLLRTNGARCDGPTALACARCRSEIYRRFRMPSNNSVGRPFVDALWYAAERIPALATTLGVDEQASRQQIMIEALNKASGFIAPSRFLAELYMRYGVNPDRMHIWRQGVNVNICPIRKPSPVVRFGYFGQIKHHKGVHTLIEAWGGLKGERQRSLVLYGSAHGEEEYGEEIQARSHSFAGITWSKSIAHNQVWQALAEIDVLVVPSRWFENSPNVILEAQAMGVVIIGTDLGGVAELVEHGRNGLRFTVDDADSLRAQMQRLLDEPELLPELRKHQIPFHSFYDELDQIEGLYNQLIIQAITSETGDHILHTDGTYSTTSQHAIIEME